MTMTLVVARTWENTPRGVSETFLALKLTAAFSGPSQANCQCACLTPAQAMMEVLFKTG